ncbi:CKLF-like MARVEL transmembrane domain-containing protein 5 [Pelodytes ibericus]
MSEQEETTSAGSISLHKEFLKSLKGRILLTELVLCFVVFISFAASLSSYLAAPLFEFIITLFFIIIIASQYHLRLTALNWPCMDFLRCVSAALIMFVVSTVATAQSMGSGGAITAGVFGFFLVCVFCYDAFTIYREEIQGQKASEGAATGTLLHIWWECNKIAPFWKAIYDTLQHIVGKPPPFKPVNLLLHYSPMTPAQYKKTLTPTMLAVANALIPAHWKSNEAPTLREWINQVEEVRRMVALAADTPQLNTKYTEK